MSVAETVALLRDLIILGAVLAVTAAAVRRTVRARRRVYALWRTSDDPNRTGWATTDGGRVIVSDDPEELRAFGRGTEVKVFPPTVTYAQWVRSGRVRGR